MMALLDIASGDILDTPAVPSKPALEVADVIRIYGADYMDRYGRLTTSAQRKVLRDLVACRTATLGGHVEACDACGHQRIAYNSCRNRNCPKCQGAARAQWREDRSRELLPVEYFHVVFTLPSELHGLALQNPAPVYKILFQAMSAAMLLLAANPDHLGADLGFFAILHTWGQNLHLHPHLHCVVPGGGLAPDRSQWLSCKPGFFLPVAHRVAISNQRLIKIEDGQVHFHYKDYAAGGVSKTMALDGVEFLRRFMQHVMPRGFWRIRHFGWMANRHRTANLELCRRLLQVASPPPDPEPSPEPSPPKDKARPRCPCCGLGNMVVVEILQPQRVPAAHAPRPITTSPKEPTEPTAQQRQPPNSS